jgi:hypothetical protein
MPFGVFELGLFALPIALVLFVVEDCQQKPRPRTLHHVGITRSLSYFSFNYLTQKVTQVWIHRTYYKSSQIPP